MSAWIWKGDVHRDFFGSLELEVVVDACHGCQWMGVGCLVMLGVGGDGGKISGEIWLFQWSFLSILGLISTNHDLLLWVQACRAVESRSSRRGSSMGLFCGINYTSALNLSSKLWSRIQSSLRLARAMCTWGGGVSGWRLACNNDYNNEQRENLTDHMMQMTRQLWMDRCRSHLHINS